MRVSPRDVMAGATKAEKRQPRTKCACGNPAENRWGTCDECENAAYDGDANGEW